MQNMSVARAQCYILLEGLESSIGATIVENFNGIDDGLLRKSEAIRALRRLRDDMQDDAWNLSDVNNIDLLPYLDLRDLITILNRHKPNALHAHPDQIQETTAIIGRTKLYDIRNRVMHPVRPLETNDFEILRRTADELQTTANTLVWTQLAESQRLLRDPAAISNTTLPPYWIDDRQIVHNLPAAEFDDTGFIGRTAERRKLKRLIQSTHHIITVVGAGGIGKTALALRVCHDIADDPTSDFTSIIWVSLKTHRLTIDGIQDIKEAVQSTNQLAGHLTSLTTSSPDDGTATNWDAIVAHITSDSTLLVIDNLETLGAEIRDLAIEVPLNSTLLLTSRVGLGELELRFPISELTRQDATRLMKNLGAAYGYDQITRLKQATIRQYCSRLHNNALLIKWFVQAVGKGATPQDVLAHDDFDQALRFCLDNVYSRFSPAAIHIIGTMLSARRSLSQTQVREITQLDRITFQEALLELLQSNIIEANTAEDASSGYHISRLVLDYLSRNHSPSNAIVSKTRSLLRAWTIQQDQAANRKQTYRYARNYIHIENQDQLIAARYLGEALNSMRENDFETAADRLKHAEDLTPDWSEVHRLYARLLELEGRPIYDVESAYETSIQYSDNDISRRHYALYLMKVDENERALQQIDAALSHPDGLELVLRSLRGVILARLVRLTEAVEQHEYVWQHRESNTSRYDRIVQGTQYADSLRRYAEQLFGRGEVAEAASILSRGIQVAELTAQDCGWDRKLSEVAVELLAEGVAVPNLPREHHEVARDAAIAWDTNLSFGRACTSYKTRRVFERNDYLCGIMPRASRHYRARSNRPRMHGKVTRLMDRYGFIRTDSGESVYMNPSSLIDPGKWRHLSLNQIVAFDVVVEDRGSRAIRLGISDEVGFGISQE